MHETQEGPASSSLIPSPPPLQRAGRYLECGRCMRPGIVREGARCMALCIPRSQLEPETEELAFYLSSCCCSLHPPSGCCTQRAAARRPPTHLIMLQIDLPPIVRAAIQRLQSEGSCIPHYLPLPYRVYIALLLAIHVLQSEGGSVTPPSETARIRPSRRSTRRAAACRTPAHRS